MTVPTKANVGGFDYLGLIYVGLVFFAIFFPVVLERFVSRPTPPDSDSDSDGGSGGRPPQPRTPSSTPRGGLPLPDAEPTGLRLRGPGRLAEHHRARERRPAHAPDPSPKRSPARTPGGGGSQP
jgi:hypothetical protein